MQLRYTVLFSGYPVWKGMSMLQLTRSLSFIEFLREKAVIMLHDHVKLQLQKLPPGSSALNRPIFFVFWCCCFVFQKNTSLCRQNCIASQPE